MMFLQYLAMGTFSPILSHYLKDYLGFEPFHVGLILATLAAGTCIAPFMEAFFVGRLLGPERFLAVSQFAAAAIMWLLSRQTEFLRFWAVYAAYAVMFMPSIALTNTIALHHVPDARREFGSIRMWGTTAWVVVAWTFGLFWLTDQGRLPDALKLSALCSLVYGCYALTLPRSEPSAGAHPTFRPWRAIGVFMRPSLLFLCGATLLVSVIHQYYYYGMSPFLSQIGFAENHIMPVMSLGQISEAIVLGVLGMCLARLGIKRALVLGVLAQVLRCAVFAVGHPKPLVVAAIPSHGICYAFFFTAAYLYLDTHCSRETRGNAQQLFTIIISGLGPFIGFLVAGKVAQLLTFPETTTIDYPVFWLVPTILALGAAIVISLFFRETRPEPVTPEGN